MTHLLTAVLALLLAGCATVNAGPFAGAGGDATYLKRETGEMQHCRQERSSIAGPGVIVAAQAGSAYAKCKSSLEAAGFERMQ
jgi:hypothetical protein